MKKSAIVFITNHPDQLLFYKNMALMRKAKYPTEEIILCRIMNPYDAKTDFAPYKSSFSHVIEFPRIYKKNPFVVVREILLFRKQLGVLKKMLRAYTLKGIFCVHSAWIGVNILLRAFRNVPAIYRWILVDTLHMRTLRYDRRKSWYYQLYAFACFILFLPTYKAAAKMTTGGVFVDFHYAKPDLLPGKLISLKNPCEPLPRKSDIISLPFPLFSPSRSASSRSKKVMVVIFGDSTILSHFGGFLKERTHTLAIMKNTFLRLEKYYKDSLLYYKPHPADEDMFMSGIRKKYYHHFSASLNAQQICEEFHPSIRAAYTFTSVSALWASFFGIPSYALYPLICNDQGKKFFNEFFSSSGGKKRAPLIQSIQDLDRIGTIDHLKRTPPYLNPNHSPLLYDLFH